VAVFDRLDQELQDRDELIEIMWSRREIENYLCKPEVLLAWAREHAPGSLFAQRWVNAMEEAIEETAAAMETLDKGSPWSGDSKVTDDFLNPLFRQFFQKLELPNLLQKTDYHVLASYLQQDEIDDEVRTVLDRVLEVSERAKPA
jgi:hypothetical protein